MLLIFPDLRIHLFQHHFWKVFLLPIEFWVDTSVSLNNLKKMFHYLSFSMISVEKSLNYLSHSSICGISFFSNHFQGFLHYLWFSVIWLWCLGMVFFEFTLSVVNRVSCIYKFISFSKFGEVWVIISSKIFCITVSSSSGVPMTQMLDLLLFSHLSLRLCSFPFDYFSLFFRWDNLYLQVHWLLPSACLFCYWFHPLNFLF